MNLGCILIGMVLGAALGYCISGLLSSNYRHKGDD